MRAAYGIMHDAMKRTAARARALRRSVGVDVSGAVNLVGWLIKFLAPAFLFPVAIALGYGETPWPFLVAGAITFGVGDGCERLTAGRERIGAREGYLAVALVWLLIAVFGAIPYLLAEPQLARPLDALAERPRHRG
jgi:trk system potassium uptake protein TrkH